MTDFPCMGQYFFTGCPKNIVQLLHIIAHIHRSVTDGLYLGKVKITGYHLIQNPKFFL